MLAFQLHGKPKVNEDQLRRVCASCPEHQVACLDALVSHAQLMHITYSLQTSISQQSRLIPLLGRSVCTRGS